MKHPKLRAVWVCWQVIGGDGTGVASLYMEVRMILPVKVWPTRWLQFYLLHYYWIFSFGMKAEGECY